MIVDESLGSFDEVAAVVPAQAPTLRAIRALVAELHPDAHEKAARVEKSVWWGFGTQKMTQGYVWAMPHARHTNLGFFMGTSLADPAGRLEGTGKALRHVKLAAPEAVADPAIRALVVAARDERRAALQL
jgi:hypothetical protein